MRHARTSLASSSIGSRSSDDGDSGGGDAPGDASFLCFEVYDTGSGVSQSAMQSLFQDYVQVGGCVGGTGSVGH